ncbi:MAG: murein hydrolase activator EnvC family protein [Bacteroidota bacterium]
MKLRIQFLIAVIAILFLPQVLTCGGGEDLKNKQAKLEKLRDEIQQYEDRIKDREKKESSTLDLLDTYDRQMNLVRKLINGLHEQEVTLQQNITQTRGTIRDLEGQLGFLKINYAHYVSSLYRYGRTYDLELLLSSKSVNQVLIRSEYLKRFSEQRKNDMDKISDKKDALEEETMKLQQQLGEQRDLISAKAQEEQTLAAKVKKRKVMLAEIRRDKKNLKREIQRTTAAAKDLENLITKLIEEEHQRKLLEARKAKENNTNVSPSPSTETAGKAFMEKRGRMRWPVGQGKIVAHFGNHQHPILHTITQNTGIDISLPVGSDVDATSEGQVSAISWLPSFGNLIILDHNNGFRTVYAHLSEITVSEGQHVAEGSTIGKSGESLDGPVLHFELWKDREKQDPELWLAPRGLSKR